MTTVRSCGEVLKYNASTLLQRAHIDVGSTDLLFTLRFGVQRFDVNISDSTLQELLSRLL